METFIQSNTSVLIVLTTRKKNKENRTKRPDKLDKNTSTKFLIAISSCNWQLFSRNTGGIGRGIKEAIATLPDR